MISRFIPFIRTFAPFLAGIGEMPYLRFLAYNILGGVMWVTLFLSVGFLFGNLPLVKEHFTLIVYAIIGISMIACAAVLVKSLLAQVKKAVRLKTREGQSTDDEAVVWITRSHR